MNQPTSRSRNRSLRPALVSILLALILFSSLQNSSTPALRGAPVAELTPLAYLPLIERAGPTATKTFVPTSTPTATATATATPSATATPTRTSQQRCLAVYPIGLNAALFNANGFAPPTDPAELPYYGIYNDATYTNKTQRRVYGTSSFGTPGYHILKWLSSASSVASFAAAITGTGTLAQGFDEVTPWPDPSTSAPEGYPLYPHQLSPGDWIYGFTGNVNSSDVTAALRYHVDHKTVMSLPIVDRAVGNGQNIFFHHAWLGDFLLRGFSLSAAPSYFDLVYIGATDLQIPLCP